LKTIPKLTLKFGSSQILSKRWQVTASNLHLITNKIASLVIEPDISSFRSNKCTTVLQSF